MQTFLTAAAWSVSPLTPPAGQGPPAVVGCSASMSLLIGWCVHWLELTSTSGSHRTSGLKHLLKNSKCATAELRAGGVQKPGQDVACKIKRRTNSFLWWDRPSKGTSVSQGEQAGPGSGSGPPLVEKVSFWESFCGSSDPFCSAELRVASLRWNSDGAPAVNRNTPQ